VSLHCDHRHDEVLPCLHNIAKVGVMLNCGRVCFDLAIALAGSVAAAEPHEAGTQAAGAQAAAVDSIGDPLPDGALLRLGTSRFRSPASVYGIAVSPDEKVVVTVGEHLIVWDKETGKEKWRAHSKAFGFRSQGAAYGVNAVAFGNGSEQFYTPGYHNDAVIWDVVTGKKKIVTARSANQLKPVDQHYACRAVDVTADEALIAVGSQNGVVVCDQEGETLFEVLNNPAKRFDLANDKDRLKFGGHFSFGRFSPDGNTIAIVTSDAPETIRLHESLTGKELRRIALKAWLVRLAFSPDGKCIAATERDSAVRFYETKTGKELWSKVLDLNNPYENYTSAIVFSPGGESIVAGATDHLLYVLSTADGQQRAQLKGHKWYPWALAFAPQSKTLYSSGWDGAVRKWDMETAKQLPVPQGVRGSNVVAAAADGKTLAYVDDEGTIRLCGSKDGTERRSYSLPGKDFSHLAFSPDSRQLAAGGNSKDKVHVAVWNVDAGEVAHLWEWDKGRDPHSAVESLSFTPDGKRLAAAVFRQSAAYLWDLTTGEQIKELKHNEIYGLSFSPTGSSLTTVGWDSIIRNWDAGTGELQSEMDLKGRPGSSEDLRMYTVCHAPEGGLMATAHLDGSIRIWRAEDMTLLGAFRTKGRFVYGAMAFSPDGLWLATGGQDGSIVVWDPRKGEAVWDTGKHQDNVYTVQFGRDSRTLLSGGDDGVGYLWNLRPSMKPAPIEPAALWNDLADEDGAAAYQAMWAFAEAPKGAVSLIAEKFEGVSNSTDFERPIAARRAVAVLSQIGTPNARRVLEELAKREPTGDISALAAAAQSRIPDDRNKE
jgi:WD40 repeat protein